MGFRSSVSLLPAIQTTGLWLLPRRASPAERASLCWTHVGSGLVATPVCVGPQSRLPSFQPPRYAFSRTTSRFTSYAAYSAFALNHGLQVVALRRRLSHLSPAHVVRSARSGASLRRRSSGSPVLPAHSPPSRCQPISRGSRLYGLPAPPISTGLQLLTRPRHRSRRSAVAPQQLLPHDPGFRPRLEDSASGPSIFRGHLCVHSRYGPATADHPLRWSCQWASDPRFPSSLPSKLQGSGSYPGGPTLNAPAFAGRTSP